MYANNIFKQYETTVFYFDLRAGRIGRYGAK